MGIGNIKIVFQPLTIALCILKYGDAAGSSFYPSAELLIPPFDFENSGSVRTLGKYKYLFIKPQAIIPTSRLQKMTPLGRTCQPS